MNSVQSELARLTLEALAKADQSAHADLAAALRLILEATDDAAAPSTGCEAAGEVEVDEGVRRRSRSELGRNPALRLFVLEHLGQREDAWIARTAGERFGVHVNQGVVSRMRKERRIPAVATFSRPIFGGDAEVFGAVAEIAAGRHVTPKELEVAVAERFGAERVPSRCAIQNCLKDLRDKGLTPRIKRETEALGESAVEPAVPAPPPIVTGPPPAKNLAKKTTQVQCRIPGVTLLSERACRMRQAKAKRREYSDGTVNPAFMYCRDCPHFMRDDEVASYRKSHGVMPDMGSYDVCMAT